MTNKETYDRLHQNLKSTKTKIYLRYREVGPECDINADMEVGLEAKYCLKLSKTLGSKTKGGMFSTESVSTDGAAVAANFGG